MLHDFSCEEETLILKSRDEMSGHTVSHHVETVWFQKQELQFRLRSQTG